MSGMTDQRPEFQRMIGDALSRGTDLILLHSFDRLFRDPFLTEKYRRKLLQRGVSIASVTQAFSSEEPSQLMQQLASLLAEWQSSERRRKRRLSNRVRGRRFKRTQSPE
jgi:site-specific DNA recombinase